MVSGFVVGVVVAVWALSAVRADAVTTTWTGADNVSLQHADNWTAGVPGATDTAVFGPSPRLAPNSQGNVAIGAVVFAANAPAYTITANAAGDIDITGGGIVNGSTVVQTLVSKGFPNLAGAWGFHGVAGILAGTGLTILNEGGSAGTGFHDDSRAGTATIRNQSVPAGGVARGSSTVFLDSSSASFAQITNFRGDGPGFDDPLSTVGIGATIFRGGSTAASASITNQGGQQGGLSVGARTLFLDNASAGQATIVNQSGGSFALGALTEFAGSSSAGSATINNNGFFGSGAGALLGLRPGRTLFYDNATAGNATIINSSGSLAGGTTVFSDNATAGNARLDTRGSSSGTGGVTRFLDFASGGNATAITGRNGTFDISGLSSSGTSIGSISGAGNYVLGSKTLSAGGTFGTIHASTTVSGVISGEGGSLRKFGNGSLTLLGANTYSGSTALFSGAIIAANTVGSATGSGPVFAQGTLAGGNSLGTSGFIAGDVFLQGLGGGRISPGLANASAGLLTLQSDLSLSANSVLEFQLLTPDLFSALDNDRLAVAGDLVLDGIFDIDTALGFGGAGEYRLITYGGNLTDNGLALGALPAGFGPSDFLVDVSQPGEVVLRVGRTQVPVPAPASAVLLFAGGLLLIGRGLIRWASARG